ncbi:UNVERIFIED_CONTAM: hypothetical protein GTU68_050739 [Idotea baltica]|nr:hypothetical protein [Idotea baltica]
MSKFSKRQYSTLIAFCVAQFCNGLCISIQAPFYPKEAEDKGAVPSQYGFVFGVYELVVFIFSPIYGKFLNRVGVKLVNNTGIFTVGICCILFGFLDKIDDTSSFIGFSFAIRIIEATGTAAFTTAAFSIIAKEFPSDVGSTFALIETFFGIGLILGPTVGGGLYELGGFILPFAVIGSLLLGAGFLVLCLLPNTDNDPILSSSKGMMSLLKLPPILLGAATVFGASLSIGFVQATLEPHLRSLNLSPLQLGFMFVLNGAAYALLAPIWGKLSDKWLTSQTVSMLGAFFIACAFILLGPAPFLPLHMSLSLCIIALISHGLGIGAELVSTFSGFHKDAIKLGFPDDIGTYGLVSGLWTSTFALGAFVGPSLSGVLFDTIGFPWAAQLIVGYHLCIFLGTGVYILFFRNKFIAKFEGISSNDLVEREAIITRDKDLTESYGSTSPRDL